MSTWGTGIKQSDEFMDVYEEFFDLYRDDAVAIDIYRAILTEYQEEFSSEETSPMLYTVYYALAQCLWECGERDEWLWQKIKSVIDSDADLKFWNELLNEPQTKKSRRRALQKFWERINSTPPKIRKPKRTQKKREATLQKGDVYAYVCENGYRAALVLDFVWNSYLTAITEEIFDHVPSEAEVMLSHTHTVAWFTGRASVPKKDRVVLARLTIDGNYNNRAGLLFTPTTVGCSSVGERTYFYDLDTASSDMERNHIGRYEMKELLDPGVLPAYLPKIDVG
ncbi:MAG: hypothetical protein J6B77_07795 [Clostridia bacterium]|nr:hypothetical protein [Clostridia bacterium]